MPKNRLKSYSNLTPEQFYAERIDWDALIEKIAQKNVIPSIDLLQDRLSKGCHIEHQEDRWCLFDEHGEGVCSGKSLREMLVSLIFVDC